MFTIGDMGGAYKYRRQDGIKKGGRSLLHNFSTHYSFFYRFSPSKIILKNYGLNQGLQPF